MLIGVDVSPAAKEKKTGIEWYCFHVANELAKLDSANQYRFYTKTPVAHQFEKFPSNYTEVVLPDRSFWTHTALAMELKKNPVDVFYSPAHIIPWYRPKKTVGTIHDAGFRHYRKNYSTYQFIHATLNTWTSAIWSDKIIVPAEFIANDIAGLYHLNKQRIEVVPNGFDAGEFENLSAPEIETAKNKFGLTKPYLIFVGRAEVRKNMLRTLQAFFKLVNEKKADIQFLLVGSPGQGFEEIEAYINAQPNADRVVKSGYVSAREKAALMAGSRGLAFPSLYEGFGIPILEGFAAGTPVMTSNITACPEVAGDAAIIVDPFDVGAIARGMETMLFDDAARAALIEKGHRRVRDYSWERTAREAHRLLVA